MGVVVKLLREILSPFHIGVLCAHGEKVGWSKSEIGRLKVGQISIQDPELDGRLSRVLT